MIIDEMREKGFSYYVQEKDSIIAFFKDKEDAERFKFKKERESHWKNDGYGEGVKHMLNVFHDNIIFNTDKK